MLNLTEGKFIFIDLNFDIRERLAQLKAWKQQWEQEETRLRERLVQLDEGNYMDQQEAVQIASLRKRAQLLRVQYPLAIAVDALKTEGGYKSLRGKFQNEFARLTADERILWLTNFLYIKTPELLALSEKLDNVRSYQALGQHRNFLLGGPSGMGKTTNLNWYISQFAPTVEKNRNHIPIIKLDAPVNNRSDRVLFQRMILACGRGYLKKSNDEELLMKVITIFQKCGVEVVIIDEIEHIRTWELRRRLLEVSNLTPGVTFVCASCQPERWVQGDEEVQGRWNDQYILRPYTGDRVKSLLSFIELLLPFSKDSSLPTYQIAQNSEQIDGPARLIERLTGGVLRDIMILIADACGKAIKKGEPNLSPSLLQEAWQDIQTRGNPDFLDILKRYGD